MTSPAGLNLTELPAQSGTVLVAGDGGLLGSYAATLYHQLGCTVHGVSRRALPDVAWLHHRVDLLDNTAIAEVEGLPDAHPDLANVTHLVFGAYIERQPDESVVSHWGLRGHQ